MESYISVGSLIIAGLALVVSPWITWYVAKYQTDSAQRMAAKQIISPMRQAWIDALRNRVAEIISEAHWFYVAGYNSDEAAQNDNRFMDTDKKLVFLRRQVELMLNPKEEDHQRLNQLLDAVSSSGLGSKDQGHFSENVKQATAVCQEILKREWERVKHEV